MREWELRSHPGKPWTTSLYNWRLRGDVDLSLAIVRWSALPSQGVVFELARKISDPILARTVLKNSETELKMALEDIQRGSLYIHPYWIGYSPDDLRSYCEDNKLPVPNGYEQAFSRSVEIHQAQRGW